MKNLKLGMSLLVLMGILIGAMSAHAEEQAPVTFELNEPGPVTINTAKKAALKVFEQSFEPQSESDRIRFQKSNSVEYTPDYLLMQMEAVGPNNRNYKKYNDLLMELKNDSSLKIFCIFLATGSRSAGTATQDIFLVKLRRSLGSKVFAEVSRD